MGHSGAQIDHVVIGVKDLEAAARAFDSRYGLTAIEGGRHPGWGTANRLVPLGHSYLELVTVVDRAKAATNTFGRWISAMLDGGSGFGWAVRTDDLAGVASRLGLEIVEGSRHTRTGELLQWQVAGVAQAADDSALPFFIQWAACTTLPGRIDVQHRAGTVRLEQLQIESDKRRLQEWLGINSLPLDVRPGIRGLTSVTLATSTDTILVTSLS